MSSQPPFALASDFRMLVERAPQLISRHNKAGIYLYASPSYTRLLGYSPDTVLGRSLYEFVHPAEVDLLRTACARAWSQDFLQPILCRVLNKQGECVWVELLCQSDRSTGSLLIYGQNGAAFKYMEDALRILARGTDSLHDLDFFRALVSQVAAALRMPFAFVTEHVEAKTRVRMLAFWQGQDFGSPFEYALTGTPCDDVINQGKSCYYPNNIQSIFPHDRDLVTLAAQGYIGVPIYDSEENVIGHLAVLDSRPISIDDREMSILKIFALRAGVELERMQAKRAS